MSSTINISFEIMTPKFSIHRGYVNRIFDELSGILTNNGVSPDGNPEMGAFSIDQKFESPSGSVDMRVSATIPSEVGSHYRSTFRAKFHFRGQLAGDESLERDIREYLTAQQEQPGQLKKVTA